MSSEINEENLENYISFIVSQPPFGKGYYLTIESLLDVKTYAVTLDELLKLRDLLNDKFPKIKEKIKGYISFAEHKKRINKLEKELERPIIHV